MSTAIDRERRALNRQNTRDMRLNIAAVLDLAKQADRQLRGADDLTGQNTVKIARLVGSMRALTEEAIGNWVGVARDEGMTWRDIGQVLGVTKQAAQQHYGRKAVSVTDADTTQTDIFEVLS